MHLEAQKRFVEVLTAKFSEIESVKAVALAGSRGIGTTDADSDYDLYVYSETEVPLSFRCGVVGKLAEIDNRFWEPGDEVVDKETGAKLDIMYRSPRWIEDQLERVLARHEACVGYSTCFWFNVLQSEPLMDTEGWYEVAGTSAQTVSRRVAPGNCRQELANSATESVLLPASD